MFRIQKAEAAALLRYCAPSLLGEIEWFTARYAWIDEMTWSYSENLFRH